jgi:hypothetical protein
VQSYRRYAFTDDDLRLIDDVHRLIVTHHDRFVEAGSRLDQQYSVDAILERHRPPIPESQRLGMLDRVLSGETPDASQVQRRADEIGDRDRAEEQLIRQNACALMLPSRADWESSGKRLNEARLDLYREYLPVETPSPGWDWSAHVLLMFWLIVEPRAESVSFRVTGFQDWPWDPAPLGELHPDEVEVRSSPRSMMGFGVHDWPGLLTGVRRAMRCAHRLGLLVQADSRHDDPFRPASYYPKKMRSRLRHAARANRKNKCVRTRKENGVVLYSVVDARKWWPNECPKHD